MNLLNRKFLRVMKAELEDLHDHVRLLIEQNRERRARGEATEHVSGENIAVLGSEECGIQSLIRILERTPADEYRGLDEMIADLKERFRERIEQCGMPGATFVFAERKMHKVRWYVLQSHLQDRGHDAIGIAGGVGQGTATHDFAAAAR